jgi:hypothetical protein
MNLICDDCTTSQHVGIPPHINQFPVKGYLGPLLSSSFYSPNIYQVSTTIFHQIMMTPVKGNHSSVYHYVR